MQGRIITAPEIWDKNVDTRKGLFLAGGITNCSSWQVPVGNHIIEELPIIVVNPRRENWDMTMDHRESVIQILWENKHLKKCDHILFWFPATSICPITLLELGGCLNSNVEITVGTDPDYSRRFDVEVQTSITRPCIPIWDNLDKMVNHLISTWH